MMEKLNPLATEKISKLIFRFAVPAIVGGLVGALYNIVDQIFIGQSVGMIGNAATNVAFPLTTITLAISLLLGIGSASNFSLNMGAGNKEKAGKIAGNGISVLLISGTILCIIVIAFLEPLLRAFGATDQVMPYALTYTGITSFGLPFFMIATGGSHLIRADGSPTYGMICTLTGAIINLILDPILIFTFDMGMAGAAIATIIGQIASALLALRYFSKFKTLKLTRVELTPKWANLKPIIALGGAACINQLAMTIVQITMNNVLKNYGEMSVYGSDIPLACVGVITKVNIIFFSIVLGISQGCQPICGFNYGAKNYSRVKEAYKKAAFIIIIFSIISFLCFQLFPRQIIQIFGTGTEEYFIFAERYFRIFLFMSFINGIQPLTSNFFTSIGKAKMGILMSLTRQIVFLVPLILIFPIFFGIDGVMYAGPIADGASVVLATILVIREMKLMDKKQILVEEV